MYMYMGTLFSESMYIYMYVYVVPCIYRPCTIHVHTYTKIVFACPS